MSIGLDEWVLDTVVLITMDLGSSRGTAFWIMCTGF